LKSYHAQRIGRLGGRDQLAVWQFALCVFERFSMTGSNHVSQALFFKINTFGEEAFLDRVGEIAERDSG